MKSGRKEGESSGDFNRKIRKGGKRKNLLIPLNLQKQAFTAFHLQVFCKSYKASFAIDLDVIL